MTQCTYRGSYSDPPSNDGICVATSVVLEGCPIYVVGPVGFGARIEPLVNGTPAAANVLGVGTAEELFHTTDVYSCDCASTSIPTAFGHYEITIASARAGDLITFAGDGNAEEASVTVVAGGPCPGPAWPTAYVGATACDLCPIDEDPPSGDGGGCSATGGAGLLGALLVLAAIRDRRRVARLAQQRAVARSVV